MSIKIYLASELAETTWKVLGQVHSLKRNFFFLKFILVLIRVSQLKLECRSLDGGEKL